MSNDEQLDLSGDNLLPLLLEERETAKAMRDNANVRLKEINRYIKTKLNGATSAAVPGWIIECRTYKRKEYVIKAADVSMIYVKRAPEDE